MDQVVSATLIMVIVLSMVAGMFYYTTLTNRDTLILAETKLSLGKIREVADAVRNLATTGETSATVAYELQFGHLYVQDDGITIVQATINNQTRTLTVVPHRAIAYVGSFTAYSPAPFYPDGNGAMDKAVVASASAMMPIYAYSVSSRSYVFANDRVYLTSTQTDSSTLLVQIYVVVVAPSPLGGASKGSMTLTATDTVETFTYNIRTASAALFTVYSGAKNATLSPGGTLLPGTTLQIELHMILIQPAFATAKG